MCEPGLQQARAETAATERPSEAYGSLAPFIDEETKAQGRELPRKLKTEPRCFLSRQG